MSRHGELQRHFDFAAPVQNAKLKFREYAALVWQDGFLSTKQIIRR
jgi:hypothetical protein